MPKIYPQKLQSGDEIRVIAPSRSFAIISEELRNIASDRFSKLGLKVSFGSHIEKNNDFASSSIKSRIEDIHAAFSDKNVKAIITVLGGFNSNQLLRYLDWEIIKNNPKILCGFSDITALNNAIFAKTGLVSYSGPHYSTFGQKLYFEYTLDYFKKCLFSDAPFKIIPSNEWSDDAWYINQEERNLVKNNGFLMINQGQARGTIIGANLCTFNLLQGTEYFPSLTDSILFIEDDEESSPVHFDRDLQSLIHLPNFKEVEGIVIGRFQNASKISDEILVKIIKTKKELDSIPVLANVDFGHTSPIITFPIGGEAELEVGQSTTKLTVTKH